MTHKHSQVLSPCSPVEQKLNRPCALSTGFPQNRAGRLIINTMPRTYNNLIEKIAAFENIYDGYLKARKGKRYRDEVMRFTFNLDAELLELKEQILSGRYKTGEYFHFEIYEPKKRRISALPFRDRVVQHAICSIIEPLFDKKFISDSYGCRRGKGTHAGSDRLVKFLRRAQRTWNTVYCLKADIEKYFPSIDHCVLKALLRKTIRCKKTLMILDEIIDSTGTDKGLPIGNLTSQLFANVYLSELDHFVKRTLKVPFYLRYLDDFVLLHADKAQLKTWQDQIEQLLTEKLALSFNRKTTIFPVTQGVDFLGYRTWTTHKLLRKRSIVAMRRKMKHFAKLYASNRITLAKVHMVIASWLGHARHANGRGPVRKALAPFISTFSPVINVKQKTLNLEL